MNAETKTETKKSLKETVVVPHQGYIALGFDKLGNRVHLTQSWFCTKETRITIVGQDNLDAIINALVDVRDKLI